MPGLRYELYSSYSGLWGQLWSTHKPSCLLQILSVAQHQVSGQFGISHSKRLPQRLILKLKKMLLLSGNSCFSVRLNASSEEADYFSF